MKRIPADCRTPLNRPDLQHADAGERPSQKEYGKYFWMAERYRDHGCDDADPDYPFLMEDPLFNTLWAVSEQAMAEIAAVLGLPTDAHLERARQITAALEELFIPELGIYSARDLAGGSVVRKATINGLIPLLLPGQTHAEALLETLNGPRFMGGGALMVPSYDATAEDHDPALYWRGPAWFNMSWMVAEALDRWGRTDQAAFLRGNIGKLAAEHDFPEYVDPWNGAAHGTRSFSWTAALALDTTNDRRNP
jgi:glycogen debranching enzyme